MLLEEERNVADDDSVAALSGIVEEALPKILDLGVNDLVQLFQLLGVAENGTAQGGAIELAIWPDNRGAPALHDLLIRRRSSLDRAARKNVGIDDRRASLREELSDGGFSAADIPGKPDY